MPRQISATITAVPAVDLPPLVLAASTITLAIMMSASTRIGHRYFLNVRIAVGRRAIRDNRSFLLPKHHLRPRYRPPRPLRRCPPRCPARNQTATRWEQP